MRPSISVLNALLISAILTSCSPSPELPDGITLRVAPSNDVIITLDQARAIQVRQNRADPRIAIVANRDGKLEVVQLEQGGKTPRSMELISTVKARFSVVTGEGEEIVMIVDEDGDGLPDLKIDGSKKFSRGNIEWVEVPREK